MEDERSAEDAKILKKIQRSGQRIGRAWTESIIRLDLVLHEFLPEKSMPLRTTNFLCCKDNHLQFHVDVSISSSRKLYGKCLSSTRI